MITCKQCGKHNSASPGGLCLACTAASVRPALQKQQVEPENTLAFTGMLCERCHAPTRPINLFGGGSRYACLNSKCGHMSRSALQDDRL